MPEGDTVWRVARHLDEALNGQTLTLSDLRVPALAAADLRGQVVGATRSRGKHILTEIADLTLHTHLKMEGAWHLYRPGDRWQRPAHQARVVLATESWQAVGFSLGIVELGERSVISAGLDHLGPDLLGPDWDPARAARLLGQDPERPIAAALADQANLAGIGNLYRAELCFLFGLYPLTPVHAVPDLQRMAQRARQVLYANRNLVEQATTGDLRRGQTHYVYRRNRQPCRRCGTTIRAGRLDGRAIYWCPNCQR